MATLQVESRDKSSSAAVQRLRNDGILPMAILSKTNGTVMVKAERKAVHDLIQSIEGLNIFDVKIDEGDSTKVILKDVQRDPVSRRVTHLSLQEVSGDDVIRVNIPIRVEGTPVSVTKRSATLMIPKNEVEVKGKVNELPDEILVEVSNMGQNDRIIISDLSESYGTVEFLTSPETVLATTKQLRGMADLDAAGGAEGEEGEEGEGAEGGEASEEASE